MWDHNPTLQHPRKPWAALEPGWNKEAVLNFMAAILIFSKPRSWNFKTSKKERKKERKRKVIENGLEHVYQEWPTTEKGNQYGKSNSAGEEIIVTHSSWNFYLLGTLIIYRR